MDYKVLSVTVADKIDWDNHPAGQLVHMKLMDGSWGDWVLICPICETPLFLQHDVIVVDGKATITPSIVCTVDGCGAHFTVTRGEIHPF